MVLREFLTTLEQQGIVVDEHQLRYAIKRRKISRPDMDASLRFVFCDEHLEQALKVFGGEQAVSA